MSCERTLNFDQSKTFSENYMSIKVWLWLVYKISKNNCQTQERYTTFLDKIIMVT